MKELEFICFGDVHAEVHSRYVDDYISPIRNVFRQITTYAKNNGIKTVIGLGDLFDNPNPKDTTQIEVLKCFSPKLNYHLIMGNHEYYFQQSNTTEKQNAYQLINFFGSDLGALPNIKVYTSPKYVKIDGIPFKFLPFPHTKYKEEKEGICIGHFSVSGYTLDNGHEIKDGEKITNTKNMILGHLHTKQMPLYPGSILQANFGESPNKGFLHCVARIKNKELTLSTKWVPIVLPLELHNIVIEKPEDLCILDKYKDKKYKIKLLVKNDVALPSDLTVVYPNVIKIQGYKTKAQVEALKHNILCSDLTNFQIFNERKVLKYYLKSRGLTKLEWKEGLKIIKILYTMQENS